jgi:hypothetical protein
MIGGLIEVDNVCDGGRDLYIALKEREKNRDKHNHQYNDNKSIKDQQKTTTIDVHTDYPYVRPPENKRTYHSQSINNILHLLAPLFKSKQLSTVFHNTLPNTLDTTIEYYNHSYKKNKDKYDLIDSFIITGKKLRTLSNII